MLRTTTEILFSENTVYAKIPVYSDVGKKSIVVGKFSADGVSVVDNYTPDVIADSQFIFLTSIDLSVLYPFYKFKSMQMVTLLRIEGVGDSEGVSFILYQLQGNNETHFDLMSVSNLFLFISIGNISLGKSLTYKAIMCSRYCGIYTKILKKTGIHTGIFSGRSSLTELRDFVDKLHIPDNLLSDFNSAQAMREDASLFGDSTSDIFSVSTDNFMHISVTDIESGDFSVYTEDKQATIVVQSVPKRVYVNESSIGAMIELINSYSFVLDYDTIAPLVIVNKLYGDVGIENILNLFSKIDINWFSNKPLNYMNDNCKANLLIGVDDLAAGIELNLSFSVVGNLLLGYPVNLFIRYGDRYFYIIDHAIYGYEFSGLKPRKIRFADETLMVALKIYEISEQQFNSMVDNTYSAVDILKGNSAVYEIPLVENAFLSVQLVIELCKKEMKGRKSLQSLQELLESVNEGSESKIITSLFKLVVDNFSSFTI